MSFSIVKRREVEKRARNLCEYCISRQDHSPQSFSVEHILPKSKKGNDELENLALSCQSCNNFKYTKTEAFDLLTGQNVPLYNPRKDVWEEHFTWSSDFTNLVGISPTGRATIELLKLNRESVQNLRLALHFVGKHPPK
jgi:5-methylcytosine-specific restriction endonuclease McrA